MELCKEGKVANILYFSTPSHPFIFFLNVVVVAFVIVVRQPLSWYGRDIPSSIHNQHLSTHQTFRCIALHCIIGNPPPNLYVQWRAYGGNLNI